MTIVGVVSEIKPAERRVALTPAGARVLADAGHQVRVQAEAGVGSGFADRDYVVAGARVVAQAAEVWGESELLLKVKEPIASEYRSLNPDATLFTYLHLAADLRLTEALVASGTTAIGYETVTDPDGRGLPLLAPMSSVAGRLAAQAAAYFLQDPLGGRGVLIGGGVVGTSAARVAVGMGAEVTILERSIPRLQELELLFDGRARVVMSDPLTVRDEVARADVVLGAVLVAGAAAPKLITRRLLGEMRSRATIVDVAIDQGGCAETSKPTTHDAPTYVVDEVLHYCVANMPGSVPSTSTRALTNATLPYVQALAEGVDAALAADGGLRAGVNVRRGEILVPAVRAALEAARANLDVTSEPI